MLIGVAGSGSMGSGIAMVAATAGNQVVLMDTRQQALDVANAALQKDLIKLVSKEKIDQSKANEILSAIKFTTDIKDFSFCELIIEAVIENLEVKKELFNKIENIVDAKCIIASNTSSLSIVGVASGCHERSRIIGIHFFNPATLMPLVEIIPALTTSSATTDKAFHIITSWGKIPVIAKDTPGFIVNRIARPFYGEALKMLEEGIASAATIDEAMRVQGGFKMGPFELMDFIGNDVNYKVTETVWEQLFYDPRYRPSLTQKRMFEAGMFGRKSGIGYYNYNEGSIKEQPEKNEMKSKYIFERILAMLINEAADALYLQIASRDHIELAMTKGVNYPRGLLKWADEFGIEKVLHILNTLYSDYNDTRYRPSLLLKKMHAEKRSFY